MRVFLSWSGKPSKKVARMLQDWLPKIIQGLEIWMSGRSIRVGERWSSDLLRQLDQASFGIICVTGDNIDSAWIDFEAGPLPSQSGARLTSLRI